MSYVQHFHPDRKWNSVFLSRYYHLQISNSFKPFARDCERKIGKNWKAKQTNKKNIINTQHFLKFKENLYEWDLLQFKLSSGRTYLKWKTLLLSRYLALKNCIWMDQMPSCIWIVASVSSLNPLECDCSNEMSCRGVGRCQSRNIWKRWPLWFQELWKRCFLYLVIHWSSYHRKRSR